MTVHVTIPLDDGQKAQLDALAAARDASPADVAAEAVSIFLAEDAAFRAAVEEGLADVRAGRTYPFDEVAAALRRRMAARIDETGT